jgi:hypothetical protein
MRDVVLLADTALRERIRSRGALALAVAALAALGFALAGGGGSQAAESALLVAGAIAAAVAAASGDDLPLARASGAAEWAGALAPGRASRRVAPALAGLVAAVAAGVLASVLAALALGATGRAVPTRASTEIAVPSGARITSRAGFAPVSLLVPPTPGGERLELDLRPVYRIPRGSDEALSALHRPTTPLTVSESGRPDQDALVVPRGTVEVAVARRSTSRNVALSTSDPTIDLVVVAARVRGASRPFSVSLLVAGLLVALAGASVAPSAVLVSRFTSGPTAVLAAAVLALLGAAHAPLESLARDASAAGGGAAGAILRAASFLAPDLSGASRAFDATRGLAVEPAAIAGLAPAAAHALVAGALLALLPSRTAP